MVHGPRRTRLIPLWGHLIVAFDQEWDDQGWLMRVGGCRRRAGRRSTMTGNDAWSISLSGAFLTTRRGGKRKGDHGVLTRQVARSGEGLEAGQRRLGGGGMLWQRRSCSSGVHFSSRRYGKRWHGPAVPSARSLEDGATFRRQVMSWGGGSHGWAAMRNTRRGEARLVLAKSDRGAMASVL